MTYTDEKIIRDCYAGIKAGDFSYVFSLLKTVPPRGENASKIYWGLLLATYRCSSEAELISCGIPLTQNEYYKQAYACGSAEEKNRYAMIARATLLGTIIQIHRYAAETPDAYLANKWIGHYSRETDLADPLRRVLQKMGEHCKEKEPQSYFPGLLVAFYTCCSHKLAEFEKNCKDPAITAQIKSLMEPMLQAVKTAFIAHMDCLYNTIAKPIVKPGDLAEDEHTPMFRDLEAYKRYVAEFKDMMEKQGLAYRYSMDTAKEDATADVAAQIWTAPCGEYNSQTGQAFAMINFDNCGVTEGDRWICLIQKLWTNPHRTVLSVYKKMLSLCDKAETAGADAARITAVRNKILEDISNSADVTEKEMDFVLKQGGENAAILWRKIALKTKNFTPAVGRDYTTYRLNYKSDLASQPVRKLSLTYVREDIRQLKSNLKDLTNEETRVKEDCQALAERAFACADKHNAKIYKRQWEEYLKKIETEFADMRAKISDRIVSLEATCKRIEKHEKVRTVVSLGILVVISLIVLVLSIMNA